MCRFDSLDLVPTVLRYRGYRFFFFALDRGEPRHIHIEKGDKYAKFWLEPVCVARSKGFRDHELNEIAEIVQDNLNVLKGRWNEYFDR